MPRKNNPEQTREKILNVATDLFFTKGYEETTMQDIIKGMGMSKGAVFYHFKSKEDILKAGIRRHHEIGEKILVEQWLPAMTGLNAREKLIRILENNFQMEDSLTLDDSAFANAGLEILGENATNFVSSPGLILEVMRSTSNGIAPFVIHLLKEGLADGSIKTKFPEETAKMFLLLYNIWSDPVIFQCSWEEVERRLRFIQYNMAMLGADIVTDHIIDLNMKYLPNIYKEKELNKR